ncbi:OmpA family protein [Flavobacterium sp.]|uniref:OmpA family protein n=1 Tax=Flavobacterium sp. TaxID=239 RepID=UPI0026306031|nr:OmpA family protein [Flavobacterium sp.]
MKYFYLITAFVITLLSNAQNTITIEKKIFFEHNQFLLTTNATSTLDSLITVANMYSNYSIKIIGYTDPSGSLKYNQKLSSDRAKTVFDYFIDKKLNQSLLSYKGFGIDNKSENETIQRNTTVTFTAKSEDCYYKLNSLTGKNGTEVSFKLKNESNAKFTLEEYFSTQSMIQNEKFALDINDEVLETAGMIDIDLKDINLNDIEDGIIQVAIPTISNATYDEEMTVWIEETDKEGEKRWKNLKLKPKWNNNTKRYEFNLNVSNFKGNKISINLDKNIYREQVTNVSTGKNKKVIVVATEREEFFYDVYLSYSSEKQNDLRFSARMDKTGFAFVIPKKVNPKKLYFTGINSSGKVTFGLIVCKVSKYNKKYPLYKYIPISSEDAKDKEKAKKKGFWEWLKRIFN